MIEIEASYVGQITTVNSGFSELVLLQTFSSNCHKSQSVILEGRNSQSWNLFLFKDYVAS